MASKMTQEEMSSVLGHESTKKGFFKRFWWLFFLLILLASAAYFYMGNDTQTVKYKTVHPERKDLVITVSATGNLQPTNSVDIGIEVSGTISHVYVDYNDVVKKGQILAKLDTTRLQSQVDSAKASLKIVDANIAQSEIGIKDTTRELKRVEDLYKATNGNYPSTKEIDAAKIAYEKSIASHKALLAQRDQATASLKTYEDNLKKAVVVSPMNGVILDKTIDVGQSVVSSMQMPTLFTIAKDLKQMEVILSVDEADVGKVKEGQKVEFSVDAYANKTFHGVIKQVRMNSQIVNNVVTYETVVTVDNSDLLLRPGMTVSADITTKVVKDALIVSNAALRFSPPVTKKTKKQGFTLFRRPGSGDKKDLSMHKKKLWILEAGVIKQEGVKLGDSDGIHTVVLSPNITKQTDVIIGTQETQK